MRLLCKSIAIVFFVYDTTASRPMKRPITLAALLLLTGAAMAQTWIWFPGDMELWTGNRVNNLRPKATGGTLKPLGGDTYQIAAEQGKTVSVAY